MPPLVGTFRPRNVGCGASPHVEQTSGNRGFNCYQLVFECSRIVDHKIFFLKSSLTDHGDYIVGYNSKWGEQH
jgi:hypothetical protein